RPLSGSPAAPAEEHLPTHVASRDGRARGHRRSARDVSAVQTCRVLSAAGRVLSVFPQSYDGAVYRSLKRKPRYARSSNSIEKTFVPSANTSSRRDSGTVRPPGRPLLKL